MDDSRNGTPRKPEIPYEKFPLFCHSNGYWARKILGKFRYFGRWSKVSWQEALTEYLAVKEKLEAGEPVRRKRDVYTIGAMCNDYLTHKRALLESKDIGARRYADCEKVCDRIGIAFGYKTPVDSLTPHDFGKFRTQLSKTLGPLSLSIEIQRVRGVFNFAVEERQIDEPMYGKQFAKPSRRMIRAAHREGGSKMLSQAEVRLILEKATQPFKSMVLLGLNCGLGNHDVARLRMDNLNLETGWLDFPRPKTEVERRCPLWPETVESLKAWLKVRPKAKPSLVFVTRWGEAWVRKNTEGKGSWIDSVGREFYELRKDLNIKRIGVGFYSFRRVLETVGGDCGDQIATDFLMGHSPDSGDMAAVYRMEVFEHRLRKVTEAVRTWVYAAP